MENKNTLDFMSQGKDNNLNLVRLFAALMVVYMHSFALCEGKLESDLMYTLTFHKALSGQVGVDIFFVISGFLIYRSYDRSNNIGKYLRARFLRIWPLLALFILSTAFVIGPAISTLSPKEYFSQDIKGYLLNLVFYHNNTTLPGVFEHHINHSVNGSIWTLQYEVLCYILVLFLVPILRKYKKMIFPLIALSAAVYLFFTYAWTEERFFILSTIILVNLGRLSLQFEMGILFYIFRDKIILSWKWFSAAVIGIVAASYFIDYEIAFAAFGSYIVLYLGFNYYGASRLYNKVGDISYGVYVLSFLVQQLVLDWLGVVPYGYRAPNMNSYINFIISTAIVIPLAFISWHCFEKHILKLK
ncbi:Peptidoglycan/LPS O-acetylase OafA/YrhL, contains acyltransferase and SGNH-hydrolase domains [Pseudobutyrivibrio sp. ACV-2]|uniref:acyltransferase family protein n=1 Tax=Pseudobutyrivibrio sp. ACV-2 TaxID=1520801 RepID=UPI00089D1F4E|nr:acyltransferase [Pseudobutyrivibrio sp. ACV-2]SEA76566.1 Peptidoglycan/LPS O-acetylase OafA/YrhL, contains acyltransferase and SGNH-hydrolase domains [Pseudobutyrivibrio sp. ACV-2]